MYGLHPIFDHLCACQIIQRIAAVRQVRQRHGALLGVLKADFIQGHPAVGAKKGNRFIARPTRGDLGLNPSDGVTFQYARDLSCGRRTNDTIKIYNISHPKNWELGSVFHFWRA